MVRLLGMFGLAGIFLAVSPVLRQDVVDGFTSAGTSMDKNSPYSYIALGVTLVAALMIYLYRAAQPR